MSDEDGDMDVGEVLQAKLMENLSDEEMMVLMAAKSDDGDDTLKKAMMAKLAEDA